MSVRPVYRAWVCYDSIDPSGQQTNPAFVPRVYSERVFGDFSTESEALLKLSQYFTQWVNRNPNKQIPSFKIVEHMINESNEDLFYNNSGPFTPGVSV